jgi:hypothetical protein
VAENFACTIDQAGLEKRVGQLDSLAPNVLTRRLDGLTLTVEFFVEAAGDVLEFVAHESQCCPFFSFDVDESDRWLRLAISTPPGGGAMLEALDGAFAGDPSRLRGTFERPV